jgi:hypothetical protein
MRRLGLLRYFLISNDTNTYLFNLRGSTSVISVIPSKSDTDCLLKHIVTAYL